MMAALARIARTVFGDTPTPAPSTATPKFEAALRESDDLIRRFKEAADDPHPIRAMMADLWMQRHNVPFMATVYEAQREVQSAAQFSSDAPPDVPLDQHRAREIAREFFKTVTKAHNGK